MCPQLVVLEVLVVELVFVGHECTGQDTVSHLGCSAAWEIAAAASMRIKDGMLKFAGLEDKISSCKVYKRESVMKRSIP